MNSIESAFFGNIVLALRAPNPPAADARLAGSEGAPAPAGDPAHERVRSARRPRRQPRAHPKSERSRAANGQRTAQAVVGIFYNYNHGN